MKTKQGPVHLKLFVAVLALATPCVARSAPIITSVVESGGDSGQIAAQFTGQTFNHSRFGSITLGLFAEDVPAYTDREYEWNSVTNNSNVAIGLPSYLLGGEYIMPGNDRRDNAAYSLTITVSQPAFVYLLIDNRGSPSDGVATNSPDLGIGLNASGQPFMQWVLDRGFTAIRTGKNRTGNSTLPDEIGVDTTATPMAVGPGLSVDDYASVYGKTVSAGTFSLAEYGAPTNTGRNMYGVVVASVPEPSSAALFALATVGFACRRRCQIPLEKCA